ncbi:hypothetical protein SAMN04487977_101533 [Treponema bryantii]|uniref:Single-strand binding protein family protein n=1 Tax=Treponema bryantii TaxID=163 RepID=A0A1H9B115_9SPIR|nr:hypothetical protein [Treponema bryantii]SEP82401.1 hypothetical protein SAMN04487977_101533 [Treponema bryantii]
MNYMSMNDWSVTGRVYYLKELSGEFAGSVKIEGKANRIDNTYSSSILKFSCIMQKNVWEEAKKKGIAMNKEVSLSGHLESWQKGTSKNPKMMFIADYVLQVS